MAGTTYSTDIICKRKMSTRIIRYYNEQVCELPRFVHRMEYQMKEMCNAIKMGVNSGNVSFKKVYAVLYHFMSHAPAIMPFCLANGVSSWQCRPMPKYVMTILCFHKFAIENDQFIASVQENILNKHLLCIIEISLV